MTDERTKYELEVALWEVRIRKERWRAEGAGLDGEENALQQLGVQLGFGRLSPDGADLHARERRLRKNWPQKKHIRMPETEAAVQRFIAHLRSKGGEMAEFMSEELDEIGITGTEDKQRVMKRMTETDVKSRPPRAVRINAENPGRWRLVPQRPVAVGEN